MTKLRAPATRSSEFPHAVLLGMVLIIAALAILITQSGAIEALSDSGLLR